MKLTIPELEYLQYCLARVDIDQRSQREAYMDKDIHERTHAAVWRKVEGELGRIFREVMDDIERDADERNNKSG